MAKDEKQAVETKQPQVKQNQGLDRFFGKYVFINLKHNNYQVVNDAVVKEDGTIESVFLTAKLQAFKPKEYRLFFVNEQSLAEFKHIIADKTEIK